MSGQIKICMTMGLRPDYLEQTIESLGSQMRLLPIVVINDFGDEPTNRMFDRLCPHGRRIDLGGRVGHHAAVDAMYEAVETPYIFHIEDDWDFARTDFLPEAIALLESDPDLTSICVRELEDMPIPEDRIGRIAYDQMDGVEFARLTRVHMRWYGFTFNPHVIRRTTWQDLGGYSGFGKELDISRHMRSQGRHVGYLEGGGCRHIGAEHSIARKSDPQMAAQA